jgi:putative sterol carrier protein
LIGTDCETLAGVVGQVRLMQAFMPRKLTAAKKAILNDPIKKPIKT